MGETHMSPCPLTVCPLLLFSPGLIISFSCYLCQYFSSAKVVIDLENKNTENRNNGFFLKLKQNIDCVKLR